MRWEVVGWGALALLLFAAEALAPGAFMLWIGIGAAAVFVLVAVFSGIPLLWQVVAFVVLSVVSIQCYRRWGKARARPSDAPLRSEEHTSELQSQSNLVCRLLLEKKKKKR